MTTLAPAEACADAFEAVRRTAPAPDAVVDLRRRAFERFTALGFPTTRLEAWRFTNVAPIANTAFALAAPAEREAAKADTAPHALGIGSGLLFVNGRHVAPASDVSALPAGVEVLSLAEVLAGDANETRAAVEAHLASGAGIENEAFTALNTALLHDGAVVRVPANTVVEQPIQLLFVTSPPPGGEPVMTHPRVLLVVGENAQARVVESYGGGDSPYLTNTVTEVIAGPSAVVDHYKLVRESPAAYHIGAMHVRLGRAGRLLVARGHPRRRHRAQRRAGGARRRRGGVHAQRPLPGERAAAGRQPHDDPPRAAALLEPRAVQGDSGRERPAPSSTARSSSPSTPRRPTRSRPTRRCSSPRTRRSTRSPSWRSSPTTSSARTGPRWGSSTRTRSSTCAPAGLGRSRRACVLIHAFASDLLNHIAIEPIRDQLDDLLLAQLPGSGGGSFHVDA